VRVYLIGTAGRQADRLRALLGAGTEVVALPQDASTGTAFDHLFGPDDVLVSLRLQRAGARLPGVGLLHLPGAGLDGIDLPALDPRTRVCNVYEHEDPIAEYVTWAMLDWTLRPDRIRITAEGWSQAYRSRPTHGELLGRTIGIFGYGRIGRAVARRARAFGMRVATLARPSVADDPLVDLRIPPDDLPALLAAADVVLLAAPLDATTAGRFGAAEFRAMKRDALLINVSRAELAVEDDLYEALRTGVIGGACLDVWYRYPLTATDQVPPSRQPFLDLPNVVGTAHASAWTDALAARRYAVIADNLHRFAAGEPLRNQVAGPC
jgi:phosphoglycerate dehydrogenase-like enzyme